jgi:sulfite exporter TauE/SafE
MNLWLIFLTGLMSGGFTCLALQGGLLATAIASRNNLTTQNTSSLKSAFLPTTIFLIAKISTYTLLGFLLGIFGSVFKLTITTQIIMQFLVGMFMIVTALRMWDIHPFFRKFAITPPKIVFKFMRRFSGSGNWFAPLLLGIMTVLLPCGTTQAMEIQAIGSGNALNGALIMLAFTLGTAPFFFILGTLATKFSDAAQKYVYPIAAAFVLILGVLSIDNGLTLLGSPFTLKQFWQTTTSPNSAQVKGVDIVNNLQIIPISVTNSGYQPFKSAVKLGIPAKVRFTTQNTYSCSRSVVFPTLKINQMLPETGTVDINIPTDTKGAIPFSCSMGMYRGEIDVE